MIQIKQGSTVLYKVNEFTFQEGEMSDSTVSLNLQLPATTTPNFAKDMYVEYLGEKFYLTNTKPQGVKDISNILYTYALIFDSKRSELKRRMVRDLATIGIDTYISRGLVFSVNCNVIEFFALIQRNLTDCFGSTWIVDIHSSVSNENSVKVDVNNTYIWDLLLKTFELYGVRWTAKSVLGVMHIYVGYPTVEVNHIFEYGSESGVTKITREPSSVKLINRLRGVGGTRNVPVNYFTNRYTKFELDPNPIPGFFLFKNIMPSCFRDSISNGTYIDYVQDDSLVLQNGIIEDGLEPNEDIYPSIEGFAVAGLGRIDEIICVETIYSDEDDSLESQAALSILSQATVPYKNPSTLVGSYVVLDTTETSIFNVTDNSVSAELLLEYVDQFNNSIPPSGSLVIKTIDGKTITISGSASVSTILTLVKISDNSTAYMLSLYNGDVNVKKDIICQNIENGSYKFVLNTIAAGELYYNNNEDNKITWSAKAILYNITNLVGSYKPTFDIWVKDIQFDLRARNLDDTAKYAGLDEGKIAFKTGDLAGYEFTILQVGGQFSVVEDTTKTLNGVHSKYKITLIKSDVEYKASGMMLPNTSVNAYPTTTDTQPLYGDKFVILDIQMPRSYVYRAEQEVQKYIEEQLNISKVIDPSYTIELLDSFLKLNPAITTDIRAGNIITIADDNLVTGTASLYINSVAIKNNDLLPKYTLTVTNKRTVSGTTVQRIQSQIDALYTGQYSQSQSLDLSILSLKNKFLQKDVEDVAYEKISFKKGAVVSSVETEDFRQGQFGGSGGAIYKDADGNSVMETDILKVRKKAEFNELVINQIKFQGGIVVYSAASMEISKIEQIGVNYRLFFDTKGGTVHNQFLIYDIVKCQRFSYTNGESKYYATIVTDLGSDYIDISYSLRDSQSVLNPEVGDQIVQFGNTQNTSRQSLIEINVLGGGKQTFYEGVNSYVLTNKNIIDIGKIAIGDTYKNMIRVYGDAFIGARDLSSYFKYDSATKEMEIAAKVKYKSSGSYVDVGEGITNAEAAAKAYALAQATLAETMAKAYSDGIVDVEEARAIADATAKLNAAKSYALAESNLAEVRAKAYADGVVSDEEARAIADATAKLGAAKLYADQLKGESLADYNAKFATMQSQVDGEVNNWFYPRTPDLVTYPVTEWTTDIMKRAHVGDTFTNTQTFNIDGTTPDAGKSWRYLETGVLSGIFKWEQIADSDAVLALKNAATAQSTADGKSTTYLVQPTSYKKGDVWILASDWNTFKSGEMLFASQDSASFVSGHWVKKVKYTDDTLAQAALTAANNAASSATTANTLLTEWALDNKLNPSEKQATLKEWNIISAEKAQIDAQADIYSVSKTNYQTSYTNLYNYLYVTNSLLIDLTTTSTIDGVLFKSKFAAYYSARQSLLNAIAQKAKDFVGDSINGIKVGGRNLILKSDFSKSLEGITAYTGSTKTLDSVYRCVIRNTNGGNPRAHFEGLLLKANIQYIFQIEQWGGAIEQIAWRGSVIEYLMFTEIKREIVGFEDGVRVFYKIMLTQDDIGFIQLESSTTMLLRYPKLEIGTIPTGWSAATEDASEELSGGNIFPQAEFLNGLQDWNLGSTNINFHLLEYGVNIPSGEWSLGGNTDISNNQGLNTVWLLNGLWDYNFNNQYVYFTSEIRGIQGGKKYIASIYAANHRSRKVDLFIQFYNSAGSPLGYFGDIATSILSYTENYLGGVNINGYKRLYAGGLAPQDAVVAKIFIRKWQTRLADDSDSYAFLCRPMLEQVGALVVKPSPWTPYVSGAEAFLSTQALADIASDLKLTASEKQQLVRELDRITKEYSGMLSQALTAEITNGVVYPQYTAYISAFTNLISYLNTLLTSTTTTSTIDKVVFSSKFASYFTALEDLKKLILTATKDIANSSDYLKEAMKVEAETDGGLWATGLLRMKNTEGNYVGGLSGLSENVFSWAGGSYAKALADSTTDFKSAKQTSCLDRKDGAGHRAFGNFAWDNVGNVFFKGLIEALSGGKIGNFDIVNGNIVGYNGGIERVVLSTEAIPTSIAGLAGSTIHLPISIDLSHNGDFSQNYYTIENDAIFSLAFATTLTTYSNQYDIQMQGATLISAYEYYYFYSGTTSLGYAVAGQPFSISQAGSYRCVHRVILYVGFDDDAYANLQFDMLNCKTPSYLSSNAKTGIGNNGFYSYFAESQYIYFNPTYGFQVRLGSFVFRITSAEGIQKSINGGSNWTNL